MQANKVNLGYNSGPASKQYMNGLIDEVKIYNSALTANEILIDMNQGSGVVMGALSTASDGTTADNSSARAYCVPGDTTTCNPPVGEWKLDNKTGTTANDTSGNGNTLTTQGSPPWTQGKHGAALALDGSTQYAEKTSPSSDLTLTTAGTLEAWVKSDIAGPGDDAATYYRGIVTKVTGGGASAQEYGLDWYGSSSTVGTLRGGVGTATSY